jgi:hypothetical protein
MKSNLLIMSIVSLAFAQTPLQSCWQVFWADSTNLFAEFTDIKGVRSVDAGNSWSFNYTGHSQNTMYRIAKSPSSGTLYAATSSIHDMYESTYLQDSRIDAPSATGKVMFSTDRGATWNTAHGQISLIRQCITGHMCAGPLASVKTLSVSADSCLLLVRGVRYKSIKKTAIKARR